MPPKKANTGSNGPKVPLKSPSMKPATMRTDICAIKKHTNTRPSIERTVCHGVEAFHTVRSSGIGVRGVP